MKNKHTEKACEWSWETLNFLAQNAVVQVFAQVAVFDWTQPYRIESQFESRGSGFFVTNEGHFITNAHVVNDARSIWVHIPSLGRVPLSAKVIGVCPEVDLALVCLQQEAVQLVKQHLEVITSFTLGDSHLITPTQKIVALGYPLGQNHVKSTTGVVSGREFFNGHPLIQITAPVNPGNSGGPLIDLDGKVLGITVSGIQDAHSVGYVIPINEFKNIFDELMQGGLVHRPRLGITLAYAHDEKAAFFNNPEPAGLYIAAVLSGSLCDKAGVHAGDMLYELNGHTIDAYGESTMSWSFGRATVYDLIVYMHTGQQVTMVVYRQGRRIEFSFVYEAQEPLPIRRLYAGYEPIDYEVLAGLVLMPLADNHLEIFDPSVAALLSCGLPENRVEGKVVITYVLPGSYAYKTYSLSQGDIISYVNNIRVTDLISLRNALNKSVETGLVAIKTETGILVVLSLEKMLKDEERLSNDFMYSISQTVVRLQRELLLKNKTAIKSL